MGIAVSFTDYRPPARYDSVSWTDAQIEEAASETGTYAIIDTVSLGTPDPDPATPASRDFTTINGTAPDLWYRVVFLDGALTTSEPTTPAQNSPSSILAAEPYTTVDELARVLKIRTPSAAQTTALERVLSIAAGEINSEIDLAAGKALSGWQLDLCAQVNLDRAADLWRHTESAPGILGVVDEGVPTVPGRYSFARYVARLAVLKDQWGVA